MKKTRREIINNLKDSKSDILHSADINKKGEITGAVDSIDKIDEALNILESVELNW